MSGFVKKLLPSWHPEEWQAEQTIGVPDSIDDFIKKRIPTLTGMATFNYWSDPFMVFPVPGTDNNLNPSPWQNTHAADLYYPNDAPGGVIQMTPNVGSGGMVVSPDRSYNFGTAFTFVGALNVAAPVGLYMFARFRVRTTGVNPIYHGWDNLHHSFVIGMVDPTNLAVAGVGSGQGEGKFGAVAGNAGGANLTNFVDANPAIAPGASLDVWHDMELYTRANKWWVRIDEGAAEVDASAMFTAPPGGLTPGWLMPYAQTLNDDLLVDGCAIDIDHFACAAQSNR